MSWQPVKIYEIEIWGVGEEPTVIVRDLSNLAVIGRLPRTQKIYKDTVNQATLSMSLIEWVFKEHSIHQ